MKTTLYYLLLAWLGLVLVVPAASAARKKKGPKPPPRAEKIRLLIVTGGHAFDRDEFFKIFDGHPDITWQEVKHPQAAEWFAPDKADQYDVMVWYDMRTASDPKLQKNLKALMQKGKPLVALHHSIANYQDWDECLKLLGARYNSLKIEGRNKSGVKHNLKYKASIAQPPHPITRFMKDFEVVDETYKNMDFLPTIRPLITSDSPHSDKVVAWTHTYGKSPVAVIQLGHGPSTYKDENYRRLVIQSVRWAAGKLPDPSEKGFIPIFNGKNLDGWKPVGNVRGFEVTDNGAIRSVFGRGYGWLRYDKKQFSDFILRVEWKIARNCNSGVFFRAAENTFQPWVEGSEVQISNAPRDIAHCTASIYGVAAVDPRPDESHDVWHEYEIQCNGPKVKIFADNIPVIDVDGLKLPALGVKPLKGYIGLQDAHNPGWIEYRNIRVKELPPYKCDKKIWRLTMMAYTYRKFTLFETIDKAKALGFRHIECFPWQVLSPDHPQVKVDYKMSKEQKRQLQTKLGQAGIRLINYYGLVRIKNNEKRIRQEFEFAREMGIETIVSEPDEKILDLLDKLTVEYGINVAIHNHPINPEKNPNYKYWDPKQVMKVLEGRNKRMGVCADTGHWSRSGLDPVESLKICEGRILSLHLKDIKEKTVKSHDVPWGTGVSNIKGIMAELNRQKFSGAFSMEYEHNPDNPTPDVLKCIKFFRTTADEFKDVVDF
ncbi:MAG: family 16 glycoside hydrolase [Planctomycetota bacterium]|jgi:sugar phosphate isomerase/epimerase/type 1 glutamine amidotransferase